MFKIKSYYKKCIKPDKHREIIILYITTLKCRFSLTAFQSESILGMCSFVIVISLQMFDLREILIDSNNLYAVTRFMNFRRFYFGKLKLFRNKSLPSIQHFKYSRLNRYILI